MPYNIKKTKGGYAVRKKGSKKTFGKHRTKKAAKRQLRALYANTK